MLFLKKMDPNEVGAYKDGKEDEDVPRIYIDYLGFFLLIGVLFLYMFPRFINMFIDL